MSNILRLLLEDSIAVFAIVLSSQIFMGECLK